MATRTYVVSFTVECAPQDDTVHFRPSTVTASVSGTKIAAVGDYDREAVRMLVRFLAQGLYAASAPDMLQAVTIAEAKAE